jgi:flagellar hook assembly protein FlgD
MKCFPNPFSDDLNINYNLATDVEKIMIKVYDNQGRLVKTSEQGESLAGYYRMTWNLSDLPSGLYHICLEANGKCLKVQRVNLVK